MYCCTFATSCTGWGLPNSAHFCWWWCLLLSVYVCESFSLVCFLLSALTRDLSAPKSRDSLRLWRRFLTAHQKTARFFEAPRCAISSAKKIASEPRFLQWVKMVLAAEFLAIPSSAVKSLANGDARFWCTQLLSVEIRLSTSQQRPCLGLLAERESHSFFDKAAAHESMMVCIRMKRESFSKGALQSEVLGEVSVLEGGSSGRSFWRSLPRSFSRSFRACFAGTFRAKKHSKNFSPKFP